MNVMEGSGRVILEVYDYSFRKLKLCTSCNPIRWIRPNALGMLEIHTQFTLFLLKQ